MVAYAHVTRKIAFCRKPFFPNAKRILKPKDTYHAKVSYPWLKNPTHTTVYFANVKVYIWMLISNIETVYCIQLTCMDRKMSHDLKKNKYIPLIEKEITNRFPGEIFFIKTFPSNHCWICQIGLVQKTLVLPSIRWLLYIVILYHTFMIFSREISKMRKYIN